jgi:flagellar biosynthesis protein FlhF
MPRVDWPRTALVNLKTFRAKSMADALAAVKKDLGRDAVILHTRNYRSGGILGLGRRTIVEITASDSPPAPRPRRPAVGDPTGAAAGRAVGAYRAAAMAPPAPESSRSPAPFAVPPACIATPPPPQAVPPAPLAPSERQRFERPTVAPVPMAVHRTGAAPAEPHRASVEDELSSIKRMVGQVLTFARHTSLAGPVRSDAPSSLLGRMPDALAKHYLRLLESDVAAEIADEVVGAVRDELNAGELSDEAIVRQTVLRHLAAMVPVAPDVQKPRPAADGRPFTIALVGPTGVGKTTTVAKLAASYKLRHGKKVGLITTDTYRIAAVDQLRMYANIIGLPLKVALTPSDMPTACEALADCDAILIDTAGRSQRDTGRLEELRDFLAAARPHETHLVLSSTASEQVLLDAARRFAAVKPDRVIFTKLDEAVNFGVLFTVARRVELKLSYITTGQEVPDQIEVGRPDRLARLLLDGVKSP